MPYGNMDYYSPGPYAARSSFSNPLAFPLAEFLSEELTSGSFAHPWPTLPFYDSRGYPAHPAHNELPRLHDPALSRPPSPQPAVPSNVKELEPIPSRVLDKNAGSKAHTLYFPSAPSPFAPSSGPWTVTQPEQVQAVPEPQPSWTMSGSLDPATGVFQRAPEHPRVRTAQACEKCRTRKAKVCPHLLFLPQVTNLTSLYSAAAIILLARGVVFGA